MVDSNPPASLIDIPDYVQISKSFAQELTLASQGEKSSLPFVRNILPAHPLIQANQLFQVFVIGGTNGSMATVKALGEEKFHIVEQKSFHPLPLFFTLDDFVNFLLENLHQEASVIGMNFAYNLIPVVGAHGQIDGIMNQGNTKGHAFEGLHQKQVGKTIQETLKEKTRRDMIITVANDTVCLITSGLEHDTDRATLLAAIAGTGYNLALFTDSNTVVNVQASDFTGFTPTESGKIVDQNSNNRGEQLYNKEVAAGELYKHFNALIPLLSLSHRPLQSSEELSELAQSNQETKDIQVARELIERSAALVAAQFAGIYAYKGRPTHIVCIAQGSLFWKEPNYIPTIYKQLHLLGVPENAIELKQVQNSDIVGAIKLITG